MKLFIKYTHTHKQIVSMDFVQKKSEIYLFCDKISEQHRYEDTNTSQQSVTKSILLDAHMYMMFHDTPSFYWIEFNIVN